MGSLSRWTPAEDAQLKHLFEVERKTLSQIAGIMPGRTFFAVMARSQSLGLGYLGRLDAWTEEEDALLRQLWCVEGLSATKIELRMPGRSRNAIIGRVGREGLSHPDRAEATRAQQHITPNRAERRPSVPRNMMRFGNVSITKSVIPAKLPAPERLAADPVTLLDRAPHQCGWPVNDGNPFLYCGAPKADWHKRYCEHHACAGVARGRAA